MTTTTAAPRPAILRTAFFTGTLKDLESRVEYLERQEQIARDAADAKKKKIKTLKINQKLQCSVDRLVSKIFRVEGSTTPSCNSKIAVLEEEIKWATEREQTLREARMELVDLKKTTEELQKQQQQQLLSS